MIANLIEFPVNFLLVFLFKRSRRRTPLPNKLEVAVKSALKKSNPYITEEELSKVVKTTNNSSSKDITSSVGARSDKDALLNNDKKKKKKPFTLPWWCRIVAWVLLWLAVLSCGVFVAFFAITFGDLKTRKWITSLIVSFATAIFLTQPIKVHG